jgi:hypothetical protein
MSDITSDPPPSGAGRYVFWLLGITVTVSWTCLLFLFTHLPLPAALALGAAGIVGCAWADAVLFPRTRPEAVAAAGGLTREQAPERAEGWAGQPDAERRPARPAIPRPAGCRPGTGPGPSWNEAGQAFARPD